MSKKPAYCVPTYDGLGSHPEWKKAGFEIYTLGEVEPKDTDHHIYVRNSDYKGYTHGIKAVMEEAFKHHELAVAGTDDCFPATTAEDYVRRYLDKFPNLDGIFEASGGKSLGERQLAICPLVGREFFLKYNQGRGIYNTVYNHFYSDQELMLCAMQMGRVFQDDSLKFSHRHWSKLGKNPPAYMRRWKLLAGDDAKHFNERRADGFRDIKWGYSNP